MPSARDIFLRDLQPKFDSKENAYPPFRAVLTSSIGTTTSGTVWKSEGARLVWFRAWGAGSVNWALCDVLEPTLGLGVFIQFNQIINQYEVIRDDPLLRNEDSDPSSYRALTNVDFLKGGRFQLWLDPTMFIPLSVYPTGADTVNVVSGDYIYQGERKTYAGTVDKDLSGSRPAAGLHRLVGLYLDSANTLQTVDGATIATGSDAAEPTWPAGAFRLAVVDLDNATAISINDIDNRKVIYTEDDDLSKGAWPPPGKVYRWDVSAGLVILESDLPTAVSNLGSGDVIVLGIGSYTLTSQLSITTACTIIGPQSDDNNIATTPVSIAGDVDNGLIDVDGVDDVSFVNLYLENVSSTNGHTVTVDNANVHFTNCYLYSDAADCINADSTNGSTRVWIYGGTLESGGGYAVNLATYVSTLEAKIYHPANLIGNTGDTNAVANSSIYLFSPTLDGNSINGAGTHYGEYRDANGVTRYVGDDTPADGDAPLWDTATSRWIPGTVSGVGIWPPDGTLHGPDGTDYATVALLIATLAGSDIGYVGPGTFSCDNLTMDSLDVLRGVSDKASTIQATSNNTTLTLNAANVRDLRIQNVNIGGVSYALVISGAETHVTRCDIYCSVSSGADNAYAAYINHSSGISYFHQCEFRAVSVGGTAYGLYVNNGTCYVLGGTINGDVYVAAGETLYLFGPFINGTITNDGTINGIYYDGDGNPVDMGGKFIQRLATAFVGMQTGDGAQTIYTVPTGQYLRITQIIVRNPTASLAGGTDYDFTGFRQTVDLSGMTTANSDYIVLDGNNAIYSRQSGGTNIQITPNTGSTADADALIDLFGYLLSA